LGNLEGGSLPGTLKDILKSLWTRASLYMRAPLLGNLRRACLPGTSRVEKALGTGISSYRGSVWGTWRGGSLPGTLKDILKSLWTRASLYIGAPLLGNLEEGLSAGDFESRNGSRDGHLFL